MNDKELLECEGNIYEIVHEFPLGYVVWNIGIHIDRDYIPLCRIKMIQPFEGAREIDKSALKALYVPEALYPGALQPRVMHYAGRKEIGKKEFEKIVSEVLEEERDAEWLLPF